MRLFEIKQTIQYIPVCQDMDNDMDDGYDIADLRNQAEELVQRCGMHMLRNDEFNAFALNGETVVGVLYSSGTDDIHWSLAVDDSYRNQGIAKKLYGYLPVEEWTNTLTAELISPFTLEPFVQKLGYSLVDESARFKVYQLSLS